MYNMVFLPEEVTITKEGLEASLSEYMNPDNYKVHFNQDSSIVEVMGKTFTLIYVDKPAPLEEISGQFEHKAHIILSPLGKAADIREGIDLQLALERFVLLISLSFGATHVYWSNTRKFADLEKLNALIGKSNKLYEGTSKPSTYLPIPYWISGKRKSKTDYLLHGFSNLGEKDFHIKVSSDSWSQVKPLVNYIVKYVFDSGRFFNAGDRMTLPTGQDIYLSESDEFVMLEL